MLVEVEKSINEVTQKEESNTQSYISQIYPTKYEESDEYDDKLLSRLDDSSDKAIHFTGMVVFYETSNFNIS